MNKKLLIVEDEFAVSNQLKLIVESNGYQVTGTAASVASAVEQIPSDPPHLVIIDIHLRGELSGIDLANRLNDMKIAFIYLSANSNQSVLEAANATNPFGFLVKPFREKDLLVALEIAWYRLKHRDLLSIPSTLTAKWSDVGVPRQELSNPKPNGITINELHGTEQTSFYGVIGKSPKLLLVFDHVCKVALVDTSVLILGENGTGKERIARMVHELSPRKGHAMTIVNCATLPANLIESELFGYEKGAFTGANERRTGKFEQANSGTIFLDEIGELQMALQVKLLRVLQEREFERIGGRGSVKVDVRVIAATNRNLEKEVAEGRFRMDLYYRLNVFPITLPPLRLRLEDISSLTEHFVRYYSNKLNKKITFIAPEAIDQLLSYQWPGNIRELENLIERTIVMNSGEVIKSFYFPNFFLETSNDNVLPGRVKTIEETEKDHIISVLKQTNYRVYGVGGAAELLNISPTTLSYKIRKFGIVLKR